MFTSGMAQRNQLAASFKAMAATSRRTFHPALPTACSMLEKGPHREEAREAIPSSAKERATMGVDWPSP